MASFPVFEIRKFINPILDELMESKSKDCCEIFERHFEKLVEHYDLEVILDRYCTPREITSAKCRYGSDYLEKKVNIVLFEKLLNAITRHYRKLHK
jgi:hypothetical protein